MALGRAFLAPTASGDGAGARFCAPLPPSEVTVKSGGNFEDYRIFLSCHLFGPVNHGQTWTGWERSGEKAGLSVIIKLIISDNQDETCLIITINDTSLGYLPLIITISDTCKNQT